MARSLIGIVLTFFVSAGLANAGIVVSEFRTRGPSGAADEFVELYNNSDGAIDISGWKINGSNSGGSTSTRLTINAGTMIPARGHFLATNSSASGYSGALAGNQTYTTGITDDGGIALVMPDGVTIVDQVGMSAGSAYKEGTTLAPLTTNTDQGYERKPGGASGSTQDTNNNASDFSVRAGSDPQNLSSPPTPAATPTPTPTPCPSPSTPTCGNNVPCSCGNTVVANTTLTNQDPVTQTTCSGNGLVLASAITLDLNGHTISGSGAGTGIDIACGGTVRNGTISGFGTGVAARGGTATVSDLVTSGNSGQGILVNSTSAVLAGSNVTTSSNNSGGVLISAGRADFTGTTKINSNHGGSPVNYGVQVAPGGILTLMGIATASVQVNSNDGVGILMCGNFSGQYVEVALNGIQGVWVATTDAPVFPEGGTPIRNALLSAVDVHDNGTNPGTFPPGGITVLRTRTSTAPLEVVDPTFNITAVVPRFLLQNGQDGVNRWSWIHDNFGDGINLGGNATDLCPILPAGLQCGAVDGFVYSSLIFGNRNLPGKYYSGSGVVVQEVDADQNGTRPVLFRNQITRNGGFGLIVRTSFYGVTDNGYYINANVIGSNGWDMPCTGTEDHSQTLFEGPVAVSADNVAACSAYSANSNVVGCNIDSQHGCLWNPNATSNQCRPSYRIAVPGGCYPDANRNSISGYHRFGPGVTENEDNRVAIVVKDGAWVNADNTSFLTTAFEEHVDWVAIGNDSFASDVTQCSSFAANDPCPAPAIPTSVASRKTHGGAGDFNVNLPLTGSPGVECRSGGTTNDYTIVATFAGNVTVDGNPQAEVTLGTGTVGSAGTSNGGTVTVNGNVVTIPLTNVTNTQTINVRLNAVNSLTNVTIPMTVLAGDATANGAVNSSDIALTQSKSGQVVDSTNFREDVTVNGSINSSDIAFVQSKSGTGLPPAATPATESTLTKKTHSRSRLSR